MGCLSKIDFSSLPATLQNTLLHIASTWLEREVTQDQWSSVAIEIRVHALELQQLGEMLSKSRKFYRNTQKDPPLLFPLEAAYTNEEAVQKVVFARMLFTALPTVRLSVFFDGTYGMGMNPIYKIQQTDNLIERVIPVKTSRSVEDIQKDIAKIGSIFPPMKVLRISSDEVLILVSWMHGDAPTLQQIIPFTTEHAQEFLALPTENSGYDFKIANFATGVINDTTHVYYIDEDLIAILIRDGYNTVIPEQRRDTFFGTIEALKEKLQKEIFQQTIVQHLQTLVTADKINPIRLAHREMTEEELVNYIVDYFETQDTAYMALFENSPPSLSSSGEVNPNRAELMASLRPALKEQIQKVLLEAQTEKRVVGSTSESESLPQMIRSINDFFGKEIKARAAYATAFGGILTEFVGSAIQRLSNAPYGYSNFMDRLSNVVGQWVLRDYNFLRYQLSDLGGGLFIASMISMFFHTYIRNKYSRLLLILVSVALAETLPTVTTISNLNAFDFKDLIAGFSGVGIYYIAEGVFSIIKTKGWTVWGGVKAVGQGVAARWKGIVPVLIAGTLFASMMSTPVQKTAQQLTDSAASAMQVEIDACSGEGADKSSGSTLGVFLPVELFERKVGSQQEKDSYKKDNYIDEIHGIYLSDIHISSLRTIVSSMYQKIDIAVNPMKIISSLIFDVAIGPMTSPASTTWAISRQIPATDRNWFGDSLSGLATNINLFMQDYDITKVNNSSNDTIVPWIRKVYAADGQVLGASRCRLSKWMLRPFILAQKFVKNTLKRPAWSVAGEWVRGWVRGENSGSRNTNIGLPQALDDVKGLIISQPDKTSNVFVLTYPNGQIYVLKYLVNQVAMEQLNRLYGENAVVGNQVKLTDNLIAHIRNEAAARATMPNYVFPYIEGVNFDEVLRNPDHFSLETIRSVSQFLEVHERAVNQGYAADYRLTYIRNDEFGRMVSNIVVTPDGRVLIRDVDHYIQYPSQTYRQNELDAITYYQQQLNQSIQNRKIIAQITSQMQSIVARDIGQAQYFVFAGNPTLQGDALVNAIVDYFETQDTAYMALFENSPNREALIASLRPELIKRIQEVIPTSANQSANSFLDRINRLFQNIVKYLVYFFAWINGAAVWTQIGDWIQSLYPQGRYGEFMQHLGPIASINYFFWKNQFANAGAAFVGTVVIYAMLFVGAQVLRGLLWAFAKVFRSFWTPTDLHVTRWGPWLAAVGGFLIGVRWEYLQNPTNLDKPDVVAVSAGFILPITEWLFRIAKSHGWTVWGNVIKPVGRWVGRRWRGMAGLWRGLRWLVSAVVHDIVTSPIKLTEFFVALIVQGLELVFDPDIFSWKTFLARVYWKTYLVSGVGKVYTLPTNSVAHWIAQNIGDIWEVSVGFYALRVGFVATNVILNKMTKGRIQIPDEICFWGSLILTVIILAMHSLGLISFFGIRDHMGNPLPGRLFGQGVAAVAIFAAHRIGRNMGVIKGLLEKGIRFIFER